MATITPLTDLGIAMTIQDTQIILDRPVAEPWFLDRWVLGGCVSKIALPQICHFSTKNGRTSCLSELIRSSICSHFLSSEISGLGDTSKNNFLQTEKKNKTLPPNTPATSTSSSSEAESVSLGRAMENNSSWVSALSRLGWMVFDRYVFGVQSIAVSGSLNRW